MNGYRSSGTYSRVEQLTDDDVTDNELESPTEHERKQKAKKWIWSPISSRQFIYFTVAIASCFGEAIFYFMDQDVAFISSGILAFVVCVYAFRHFRILLGLRASVSTFSQLNRQFREQRTEIKKHVVSMRHANEELREARNRLHIATQKSRENLNQFRELQSNLSKFGKTALSEVKDVEKRFQKVEDRWRDELYQHQRTMLFEVFDRMEKRGSRRGMNQKEFQEFANLLPADYADRFRRLGTFQKLARHNSQLIDYDDFRTALDLFAEMATDDVDIEFDIEKQPMTAEQAKVLREKRRQRIYSLRMSQQLRLGIGFGGGNSGSGSGSGSGSFLPKFGGAASSKSKSSRSKQIKFRDMENAAAAKQNDNKGDMSALHLDEFVMADDYGDAVDDEDVKIGDDECVTRHVVIKQRSVRNPTHCAMLYRRTYSTVSWASSGFNSVATDVGALSPPAFKDNTSLAAPTSPLTLAGFQLSYSDDNAAVPEHKSNTNTNNSGLITPKTPGIELHRQERVQGQRGLNNNIHSMQIVIQNEHEQQLVFGNLMDMDADMLRTSASVLRDSVSIADRTYLGDTYSECFVAQDAVQACIDIGIVKTEQQAVAFCEKLLQHGLIKHVQDKPKFLSGEKVFYRFVIQ